MQDAFLWSKILGIKRVILVKQENHLNTFNENQGYQNKFCRKQYS